MITKAIEQESGFSITFVDGQVLSVPNAPGNRHYQMIQEWIAEGNTPVPYEKPITYKSQFSSNDYFDRFTETEQDDIIMATATDIQVKKFYDRMWGSDFIDVEDPRTGMGLDLLIFKSLIAADRKAALLAKVVIDE